MSIFFGCLKSEQDLVIFGVVHETTSKMNDIDVFSEFPDSFHHMTMNPFQISCPGRSHAMESLGRLEQFLDVKLTEGDDLWDIVCPNITIDQQRKACGGFLWSEHSTGPHSNIVIETREPHRFRGSVMIGEEHKPLLEVAKISEKNDRFARPFGHQLLEVKSEALGSPCSGNSLELQVDQESFKVKKQIRKQVSCRPRALPHPCPDPDDLSLDGSFSTLYTTADTQAMMDFLKDLESCRWKSGQAVACKFCPNKHFNRKHDLKRHIQCVHLCEREFTCDRCKFNFKRKSHLEFHIKAVHEQSIRLGCHVCGKTYVSASSLKKHIVSLHPDLQA
jgi:hypothetical protein